MKKVLKITLIVCALGLVSFLGYKVTSGIQEKKETSNRLQTIPSFSFQTMDGNPFSKDNLKPNTPTVFIYFHSECDFCQHEALSISENIEPFKNIQLLFISTEPIESIENFSIEYNLNNQTNTKFLHDSTDSFSTQFDATSIPYLLIYDKNQKLIKKHKGQYKAESILKLFQE